MISCASPFNANLHSLPHCEGVVNTMEEVSKSESWLSDTKARGRHRARVELITFVFKNGIIFVMPRLYPEAFAAEKKKALAKVGIRRHRV